MSDATALAPDTDEVSQFTIAVACECFGHGELVGAALSGLPDFDGQVSWGAPATPPLTAESGDPDLLLVVCDKSSLDKAIERISALREQQRGTLLIYLQEDDTVQAEAVPGLTLPMSGLATGLSSLADALLTPVIPHGLIGIEWVDTRYFLLLDGQMVIEEARGGDLEATIDAAVARLRERAAGRKIVGLQASLLCSQDKLAMRHVTRLASACRAVIDDDAIFFIAAPMLERLESKLYEVRLVARIPCASSTNEHS